MSNITNEMVLAAQRGEREGLERTAAAFSSIAGVFWTRSTPLQGVISKDGRGMQMTLRRLCQKTRFLSRSEHARDK